MEQQNSSKRTFTHRIFIIVGIVILATIFLLSFGYFSYVFLLVFAGILLAVFLLGLAGWLSAYTSLSTGWSLMVVVLLLFEIWTIISLWLGPTIANSFDQLIKIIPQAVDHLQGFINRHDALGRLLEHFRQQDQSIMQDMFARIAGVFSTLVGLVTGILIILANGLYFSVEPKVYTNGIIYLLPHTERERARTVFDELGHALRWWLAGRIASMIVVGVLTWIGLLLLGIPSAPALAFFATIITFIPNLGPLLSAVPAVLIGWLQGPMMALYVILLYISIQTVESYFITPLIQRKTILLPPALILTIQLAMGFAFGILGLLLATPLAVVVLVLVQMLYVEDILGDQADLP